MRNTSDPGSTKYMTLIGRLFQHKNQKGKLDVSALIRLLMTADATDPNTANGPIQMALSRQLYELFHSCIVEIAPAEDGGAASFFYVPERAPEIADFSVTALDTGLFHNNMLSIPSSALQDNDPQNGILSRIDVETAAEKGAWVAIETDGMITSFGKLGGTTTWQNELTIALEEVENGEKTWPARLGCVEKNGVPHERTGRLFWAIMNCWSLYGLIMSFHECEMENQVSYVCKTFLRSTYTLFTTSGKDMLPTWFCNSGKQHSITCNMSILLKIDRQSRVYPPRKHPDERPALVKKLAFTHRCLWVFPFDCSDIPGKRTHWGARGLGNCACPDCIANSNDYQLAPVHDAPDRTHEQTVGFYNRKKAWEDSKLPGYTGPKIRKPANWELANTVYMPIYTPSVVFSVPTPLHLLLGFTNGHRRYLLCVCREADEVDTGKERRRKEIEIEKKIAANAAVMKMNAETITLVEETVSLLKGSFESEHGKENMLRVSKKRKKELVDRLPDHERVFWSTLEDRKSTIIEIQKRQGELSKRSGDLEQELQDLDETPPTGPIERKIVEFLQHDCNCLSAVYHGGE
jgi:hypothetical protein